MEWAEAVGALATPVTLGIAILTFALNRKREAVSDARHDVSQTAAILTELGYIKASTDDIKKRLHEQQTDIYNLSNDMAAMKESVKSAHRRLDQLEKVNRQ